MASWQRDEQEERYYQMGYRASCVEDCPAGGVGYSKWGYSKWEVEAWMRGYLQHQRDRAQVAAKAASCYCEQPLEIRIR